MRAIFNVLQHFYNWALCYRDSTRSVGLIRIGLASLIWARWASELILYRDMHLSAVLLNSAFFFATGMMFVGLWAPVSSMGTAIIILINYLTKGSWQHHHTYLLVISTFFIALTPCGRSYAVDRWLALRRASKSGLPAPSEIGNLRGMRLIAIQLSLIYFWTAYEKLYWGFLSGARMQHYIYYYYAGVDYKNVPGFVALCFVAATSTVILEFLLSFGLFVPKFRQYLMPAGIILHILFYVLSPVRTFTLTMFLLYFAFIRASSGFLGEDCIGSSEESSGNVVPLASRLFSLAS